MSSHHYMDHNNVAERLLKEWKQYGSLIVAYDFDNTVFDYHNEGHNYSEVISLLKDCRRLGAYLIVFTAAEEERYPQVKMFLEENKIPYDSINENKPGLPFKGRKIYYNVLLDDRAGLSSAYAALRYAKLGMEKGEEA